MGQNKITALFPGFDPQMLVMNGRSPGFDSRKVFQTLPVSGFDPQNRLCQRCFRLSPTVLPPPTSTKAKVGSFRGLTRQSRGQKRRSPGFDPQNAGVWPAEVFKIFKSEVKSKISLGFNPPKRRFDPQKRVLREIQPGFSPPKSGFGPQKSSPPHQNRSLTRKRFCNSFIFNALSRPSLFPIPPSSSVVSPRPKSPALRAAHPGALRFYVATTASNSYKSGSFAAFFKITG